MKILEFPELRQAYNYDCGASAIQSVLVYYGIDEEEDVIMKKAGTTKRAGTPIKRMIKTLNSYGLKCKAGPMTTEQVKKFIDKGHPVILDVQAWNEKKKIDWASDWADGHYVVAIGYDSKKIYFEDPATISRAFLTYKELEKRWHDKDTDGKKYANYGIAVYGKPVKYNIKKAVHMG
ncbi:C39 family peptidase [Patescibacteria group bacterium]|nr:C39 family peptidase [Patescibacteria group bacterium]